MKRANHGVAAAAAFVVLLLLFMIVTAGFAGAEMVMNGQLNPAHPKLARDLSTKHPHALIDVVVQYRTEPREEHFAELAQRGATVKHKLHSIRGVAMRIPASEIAALERNPNVRYISPDRHVKLTAIDENYESPIQDLVAQSSYGFTGAGIGVAVIDSGVSDHPDLHNASGTSRLVYSQSFVSGDTTTADGYGHGTHVSGIIAGSGSASGSSSGYAAPIVGMAPGVNIINLRVLDSTGAGTDSQVIAAIDEAITLQTQYNIRVINLSLGRPVFESYSVDPLCQAVEQAWKAGIVVVVAAGNSGRDNTYGTFGWATIGAPGNDPYVITVGATRTMDTLTRDDDAIASYSSKGPTLYDHFVKPDLVAPGNRIDSLRVAGSTLDTNYPSFEVPPTECPSSATCPTEYFRLSGTSMATPVVSGAVALMLQQSSTLTPDTVKARLMKTAWKGFGQYSTAFDIYNNEYYDQYDMFTYGAGYLDIDAALGSTDVASGQALSPTAVLNSNGTITIANTTITGTSVIWGNSVIWGTSVIWGNALSADSVIWGDSVVWGTTTDSGYSVIWGDSVLWGDTLTAFSVDQDGEN